jgi:spoIIIJ-associated protein
MISDTNDQVFRGKNVEMAVEAGIAALGLRRSQVEIEILHPGSRGLLGIGAEDARVRLKPIPKGTPAPKPQREPVAVPVAPPVEPIMAPATIEPAQPTVTLPPRGPAHRRSVTAPAEPAQPIAALPQEPVTQDVGADDEQVLADAIELLEGLLTRMGIRAEVHGHPAVPQDEQDEPALIVNIEGDDLGILIGRRGETLAALQYLVRLMVNHRRRRWVNIIVDVEEYKERRTEHLRQLATRMAERVVQTGKPVTLEAMPARERRIIHMTLREHPTVTTQSSGDGERRKVTIRMR